CGGGRVSRATGRAELDGGEPCRAQGPPNLLQRFGEVFLDVVGERLERGDVEDLHLLAQLAGEALTDQRVDCREKGGERLARAGRRRDQRVAARLNGRPGAPLRLGGLAEALAEPTGDGRVKPGEGHTRI